MNVSSYTEAAVLDVYRNEQLWVDNFKVWVGGRDFEKGDPVHQALQDPGPEWLMLDGSVVQAHQHAAGQKNK